MAASRGAPWPQVTRGSPERLRTRRAPVGIRRCKRRDGGYARPRCGASRDRSRGPYRGAPPSLPYPQLAVSGSVTCLLARRGSGAITGLGGGGGGPTLGVADDSNDEDDNPPVHCAYLRRRGLHCP